MDSQKISDGQSAQAAAAESAVSIQASEEYISLTVVTMGYVIRLDGISLQTTVAELVDRARRGAAIDLANMIVTVPSCDSQLRVGNPKQILREAGVEADDTLIFTSPVVWGSGWLEAAVFLGDSAAAGVVGAAAYDLLKATIKSMAARWRERRAAPLAPLLSRDEALRIAQSCLTLSMPTEGQRNLQVASISAEVASGGGSETWVVTFVLPDRSVEVKVSVPKEGPEHTMVLLDHRPR